MSAACPPRLLRGARAHTASPVSAHGDSDPAVLIHLRDQPWRAPEATDKRAMVSGGGAHRSRRIEARPDTADRQATGSKRAWVSMAAQKGRTAVGKKMSGHLVSGVWTAHNSQPTDAAGLGLQRHALGPLVAQWACHACILPPPPSRTPCARLITPHQGFHICKPHRASSRSASSHHAVVYAK